MPTPFPSLSSYDQWGAQLKAHILENTSGRELAYAEIRSTFSTTVMTTANRVEVTGLTVTVDVGDRPILVHAYLPVVTNSIANGVVGVGVFESSTTQLVNSGFQAPTANAFGPVPLIARLNPAAGEYTYNVMIWAGASGGTAAVSSTSTIPSFLQVREV